MKKCLLVDCVVFRRRDGIGRSAPGLSLRRLQRRPRGCARKRQTHLPVLRPLRLRVVRSHQQEDLLRSRAEKALQRPLRAGVCRFRVGTTRHPAERRTYHRGRAGCAAERLRHAAVCLPDACWRKRSCRFRDSRPCRISATTTATCEAVITSSRRCSSSWAANREDAGVLARGAGMAGAGCMAVECAADRQFGSGRCDFPAPGICQSPGRGGVGRHRWRGVGRQPQRQPAVLPGDEARGRGKFPAGNPAQPVRLL